MAKKRKSPPRVLFILCLLLAGSAILRGIDMVGPAIAEVEKAIAAAPDGPLADDPRADSLLAELLDREAILKEREQRLNERLEMLRIAEAEFADMIAALETAEENLSATMALSETASSDDIALLTKVYQQMKPKDAAAVFEQMTPEFAAGFLGAMKPDGAAAILSGLTPEKAYGISVLLAGRNATAPRE